MRIRLFTGLAAPLRGVSFVVRHKLARYLLWPLLLNTVVAVGVGLGTIRLVGRLWAGSWMEDNAFVQGLATAVVALLAFIALQPVVSAPFIDSLTERVEGLVTGRPPPRAGFWSGLAATVGQGALKSVLYMAALALTLALTIFTAVGGALGLAVYGLFLAYDGFDYPLGRRGIPFAGRWRYLLARPGLVAGYAATTGALMMIPLAGLVVPTLSAVGATLAYLDDSA